MDEIRQHNRRAWDALVRARQRFTRPAKAEDLVDPLATADTRGWLGGSVHGKRLLCLAAGGGRQSAIYARAGARVTVVDISPAMLELDQRAARELGLPIDTVETSMDDLSMFPEAEFDVVIHPVSTCYLPHVIPVYEQVARVCKEGGLYISQHKQPTSLQAHVKPQRTGGYLISEPYYRTGPLPPVPDSLHREPGTLEFLHRWHDLLGGLCRAGFVIEDLTEPCHAKNDAPTGSFEHRSRYIAPYVRVKARRVAQVNHVAQPPAVWTPDTSSR